jgi:hypothetical protein
LNIQSGVGKRSGPQFQRTENGNRILNQIFALRDERGEVAAMGPVPWRLVDDVDRQQEAPH